MMLLFPRHLFCRLKILFESNVYWVLVSCLIRLVRLNVCKNDSAKYHYCISNTITRFHRLSGDIFGYDTQSTEDQTFWNSTFIRRHHPGPGGLVNLPFESTTSGQTGVVVTRDQLRSYCVQIYQTRIKLNFRSWSLSLNF